MKKYLIILFMLLGISVAQDRGTIFNTYSPDSLDNGYSININQSVANRFYVQNDYVLEAIVFYMTLQSLSSGSIKVSIREDENGYPGELISDLSQWDYDIPSLNLTGYNLIVTTDLCIYLDKYSYYWWMIETDNPETEATWVHSNNSSYTYAINQDDEWTSGNGFAGAGAIFAEQIFNPPYKQGDVNFDFITNVVDIVLIVNHILDNYTLSLEQQQYADFNSDATIDVVDLVQLISLILSEPSQNPDFTLEDINPASEYFGQSIGPSFFEGQVSGYYFGKQG